MRTFGGSTIDYFFRLLLNLSNHCYRWEEEPVVFHPELLLKTGFTDPRAMRKFYYLFVVEWASNDLPKW